VSYQNATIISYIPFLLFASLKEIRDMFIRVLQLAAFVVVKLLFVVGEHFLVNCSYCNNYYGVSQKTGPRLHFVITSTNLLQYYYIAQNRHSNRYLLALVFLVKCLKQRTS